MQHKRRRSLFPTLIGLVAVAAIAAFGWLISQDIPAPVHPIEKELDAKAFLPSKP